MAKKKLQDDVLFGEQDIITPEPSTTSSTDSPTESSVDDAALRLLQTQEKLLSNYDLMQKKMNASEKQIERLSQELKTFKENQDVFVKVVQQDYTFRFDISPESLEKVHGVLQEETNAFKNETRKCTFAELTRLKHAYGDEENNIDVLRLRWWPHGYILVLILELLFCSNILLIMSVMGKL